MSQDQLRPEGELREQHANWTERHARLFRGPAPAARPQRPRPVSPFVREARERRKAQREAFDRQMLNAAAGLDVTPYVDRGWPPYRPALPYDECAPAPQQRTQITMREIIREVARKRRISVNEIISHRRHHAIVVARHEVMWRCKEETSCSLPQIGRALGGRDHTTILHGIRKHEQRMREARKESVAGEIEQVFIGDRSPTETVNG